MTDSVHPLRAFRKSQTPPLTLEALATRVGVTKASLSRVETGKQELSVDLVRKIAAETGIPARDLCPELAELFAEPAQ